MSPLGNETGKKEKVMIMKSRTRKIGGLTVALVCALGLLSEGSYAKGNQVGGLAVERFILAGVHRNQSTETSVSEQDLPSPNKALAWSLGWTLGPIAAGAVIWAAQKPRHLTEYNGGFLVWDHYEDPDRTLPLVLAATGIMIGPSVGYFYGDCGNRGSAGIAIRGIVAGVTIVAATAVENSYHSSGFMDFSGLEAAITAGVVGCGIVVIDSIYDLCLVKKNVQTQNNRKLATRVNLTPGIASDGATPTLNLSVAF
jgi:hypothetical protein